MRAPSARCAGASGSGKTTFLSTLAGRASDGQESGDIRINGRLDSLKRYRKLVGFVPQEDIMIRTLTIRECLEFSALTRLPRKMSRTEKEARVSETLALLGLAKQQFSLIGDESTRGISGGQRKRVNIGIEIVADPAVLFLDEPTSGLDSSSSKEVCRILMQLARIGMTVVSVIHQPRYEIFEMFDDVLLFGKGGRTVFLGPASEALAYFEGLGFICPQYSNPADFVMDVIAGKVVPTRGGHPDSIDLANEWKDRAAEHPIEPEEPQSAINSVPDALDPMQAATQEPTDAGHTGADDMEYRLLPDDRRAPFVVISDRGTDERQRLGTWRELCVTYITCLLMPLCAMPVIVQHQGSRRYLAGALLGALSGLCAMLLIIVAVVVVPTLQEGPTTNAYPLLGAAVLLLLGCVVLAVVVVIRHRRDQDLLNVGHFFGGAMLGPLFMMYAWRRFGTTARARYAAVLGLGTCVVLVGFIILAGNRGASVAVYFALSMLPLSGMIMLIVSALRYERLPTFDRITAGFVRQVYYVFCRACIQHTRQWHLVLFDLGLCFISGLFLGIIYFNRYYDPPLMDKMFPNASSCNFTQAICTLLTLPAGAIRPARRAVAAPARCK